MPKKIVKEDIPQVTNSAQPLELELQSIATSLIKIAEALEYIKIISACNHAPKIKEGVKRCPFCEVVIGKNKK